MAVQVAGVAGDGSDLPWAADGARGQRWPFGCRQQPIAHRAAGTSPALPDRRPTEGDNKSEHQTHTVWTVARWETIAQR